MIESICYYILTRSKTPPLMLLVEAAPWNHMLNFSNRQATRYPYHVRLNYSVRLPQGITTVQFRGGNLLEIRGCPTTLT